MSAEPVWLGALRNRQRTLWLVALLFYGVGDTVTTLLGYRHRTVAEVGPLASAAIDAVGLPGLLVLKVGFLGLCFGGWAVLQTPGRVGIPSALAVAGVAITGWNVVMLLV